MLHNMRRPAAARNTLLTLVFAVCVLGAASAGAQEPDEGGANHRDFCTDGSDLARHERTGAFSASSERDRFCHVQSVQTIDDAYRYGQALYFHCGPARDEKPFDCPRKRDVDFKVTVIKSVKKTLGLSSRTISVREANGPLTVKLEEDEEKSTYYFVPLRAEVERKMKAKKVRGITVTVSGTATGRDGKVERWSQERSDWSFNGNCGGMGLVIQRHLTYGGTCYRH